MTIGVTWEARETGWELLGPDDETRDTVLWVWGRGFYALVFGEAALFQYFTALLARSNPRVAATMEAGHTRDTLLAHLVAALAYVLGKPGAELDADLTRHMVLFDITPGHYFRTGALCYESGHQVGVPLEVLGVVSAAWMSRMVAGSIVRAYADPMVLAGLGVAR